MKNNHLHEMEHPYRDRLVRQPCRRWFGRIDIRSVGERSRRTDSRIRRRIGERCRRAEEEIVNKPSRIDPGSHSAKADLHHFDCPTERSGTLIDQKPKAMRRKNKLCEVDIAGRTYLFVHSSGRKATARRDGIALAHMERGRWSGRSTVARRTLTATDALDECVLTLFQKVVTPGRTGAFDQVLTDLSNI